MRIFRSFCLIPLLFFGLMGPLFAADDSAGIVTKVRGQVTARKTGDEKSLTLRMGDTFAVGQIIQAAKGSAAQLVLTDDSVIHLLPGTTLQVSQYTFSAAENRRSAVIRVIDGSARFIVYKRRSSDSRFAVVTDQVNIGAGNSDFLIKVSRNSTEVANVGPSFSIGNISPLAVGRVQLGTNQRSTVADKEPPSQPSTITPDQRRKYLKDAEI
jgi:ferric-dicitrate binding protein FerR (iron transport regulator)